MEAIRTAHPGIEAAALAGDESPAPAAASRSDNAAVASWLLEGRFFTLDSAGKLSNWSAAATTTFGFSRRDVLGATFVEALLDPADRPVAQQRLDALLGQGADPGIGFRLELAALTNGGEGLKVAFAVVPIQIEVSFEFNSLLQEVASGAQTGGSIAEVKARHTSVLTLIDGALAERPAEKDAPAEEQRLAGVLVVFDAHSADGEWPPQAGNVVPIAEAVSAEEVRARKEAQRTPAEGLQIELRTMQAQLEEARRAAQRARDEAEMARQEAADARDSLAAARREADAARAAEADARGHGEQARTAAESSRIRLEEALHEVEDLRSQLLEARAQARTNAERAEQGLAEERERALARDAELAGVRSELEALLERRPEVSPADSPAPDAPDVLRPAHEAELLSPQRLRQAIDEDRFSLYCQPVLDLRTGTVTQYELLIRMLADDGRVILPQAFLEPARRAGVAAAIDRWVVRRALGLLASDATGERSVEVNLSPEAVHDQTLLELIDEELTLTGVDPARLVLELTGATAADDLEATRSLARGIRARGCRFALDDFRSTFGSFRLLKELPLDLLKLDGELVGSLVESRTSELIVKALVDVARGTGMKTVAVFVTDQQTLEMLREHGVDYAQGYTVGRPQPVADVWPGA